MSGLDAEIARLNFELSGLRKELAATQKALDDKRIEVERRVAAVHENLSKKLGEPVGKNSYDEGYKQGHRDAISGVCLSPPSLMGNLYGGTNESEASFKDFLLWVALQPLTLSPTLSTSASSSSISPIGADEETSPVLPSLSSLAPSFSPKYVSPPPMPFLYVSRQAFRGSPPLPSQLPSPPTLGAAMGGFAFLPQARNFGYPQHPQHPHHPHHPNFMQQPPQGYGVSYGPGYF